MAAHALRLLVFAQQRVFGFLVVIESNFLPVTLGVACLALRPELAFVRLVSFLAVAGVAERLGLLELVVAVAFFTRHVVVFAQQRKLGLVVIEANVFPALLEVA